MLLTSSRAAWLPYLAGELCHSGGPHPDPRGQDAQLGLHHRPFRRRRGQRVPHDAPPGDAPRDTRHVTPLRQVGAT
eukprot:3048317-Prymnesium_polylepis.1